MLMKDSRLGKGKPQRKAATTGLGAASGALQAQSGRPKKSSSRPREGGGEENAFGSPGRPKEEAETGENLSRPAGLPGGSICPLNRS